MAGRTETPLHIGVLPWLAMGHLTPCFNLSTRLALLGHRVSFLSTPSNIRRLPSPLPPNLHPVALEPSVHLDVSSTADLSHSNGQSALTRAFDSLSSPLSTFIRASSPPLDWLICDYKSYWAPQIARSSDVRSVSLLLYSASFMSFWGPPEELMHTTRHSPNDFTEVPRWVPFKTSVAYPLYQANKVPLFFKPDESGTSMCSRLGLMIRDCDVVAIRSCMELEKEALELLKALYGKPVIPIGHFPPGTASTGSGKDIADEWKEAFEWLDKQAQGSVVYVAFGSEVLLKYEEIDEIARGLELSGLPYIWAIRRPNGLEESSPPSLPESRGRGLICQGWVPQVRILGHSAVGGFLTHCGWNSLVEGLQYGLALILMPMQYDQALNARRLTEIGVGKEVPRDEEDGGFDADGIATTLKLVMVEEAGKCYRSKARELRSVTGNKEIQDSYVKQFAEFLNDQ